MLPPDLQTPREVTAFYQEFYDSSISSGRYVPCIYPWATLGALGIFCYLLVDHRRSPTLTRLRHPIFALLVAFHAWTIQYVRARTPAAALGVGLLSAWGVIWTAVLMVVNDCQTDFYRIEILGRKHETTSSSPGEGSKRSVDRLTQVEDSSSSSLHHEPFPERWSRRIDWLLDLLWNFRGVGWNWQISGVPPLPTLDQGQAQGNITLVATNQMTVSKTGIRRYASRRFFLRDSIVQMLAGYLLLDLLRTLMQHDAYFWGYTDALPPAYLPRYVRILPALVKSYRLLISFAAVHVALWEVFRLGPIFFCSLLGPRWIGLRGEACMNPWDMFGDLRCALDHGLAGWWGGYWHQIFRFGFETPADGLLDVLALNKQSQVAKVIKLIVVFILSGSLHAAGSHTQLGETRPLRGPMCFFVLQPAGILGQKFAVKQLRRWDLTRRIPRSFCRLGNFLFILSWFYLTAPLQMDDFAVGGAWLLEPVPVSLFRGLGLGAKDDSFFCWNDVAYWRKGEHWWNTGIAL